MNPFRLVRWPWLLGLVLLVGSAVGTSWLVNHSRANDRPVETPERRADDAAGVVCFGHVDLEHGVTSLFPTQPGRVVEVLAQENDEVAAGAPLVRFDDRAARLRVTEARAALAAAEALLTQARKAPEQQQVRVRQQDAAIEAARHRLAAARQLLARKQKLGNLQQLSGEEVAAAEEQIKELEATARAAQDQLAELQLHDPAADVRRAEAEVAAVQARLAQAEQALEECTLRAPLAGTILRLLAGPGDLIGAQAGQPAVQFGPRGPRIVRAEVDQEFARRVAVGQVALVEDEAGTSGVCRGQVTHLSDWYTKRRSVMLEPLQRNDVRTLECLITLEAGGPRLRIGQRVRVTIGRDR